MGGYIAQSVGIWQSWTPTFTGFSADPAVTFARYTLIGKTCICTVVMGNGTSNATTFTMTLPAVAANTGIAKSAGASAVDNGAALTTTPRIDTAANSNIATIRSSPAAGAWTASSTKRVEFTITYETA